MRAVTHVDAPWNVRRTKDENNGHWYISTHMTMRFSGLDRQIQRLDSLILDLQYSRVRTHGATASAVVLRKEACEFTLSRYYFTHTGTTHSLRIALRNLILTPHVSKVFLSAISTFQPTSIVAGQKCNINRFRQSATGLEDKSKPRFTLYCFTIVHHQTCLSYKSTWYSWQSKHYLSRARISTLGFLTSYRTMKIRL